MKESDFKQATPNDRDQYIIRPYENIPMTTLVPGSDSHLVFGKNACLSFLTMKAGSAFEIHTHPEEQIMFVVEGFCDEVVDGKIYRLSAGDVIYLPSGIPHGAFIRDVDCLAIDIFSPPRSDYAEKFHEQNPGEKLVYIDKL